MHKIFLSLQIISAVPVISILAVQISQHHYIPVSEKGGRIIDPPIVSYLILPETVNGSMGMLHKELLDRLEFTESSYKAR